MDGRYAINRIDDRLYRWVINGIQESRVTTRTEELDELTSDLKNREHHLARQNKRLDHFATVVSHDLHNPLTVSKGRIDIAREKRDSEHLQAAAEGIDRSFELIDDLLALARGGQNLGISDSIGDVGQGMAELRSPELGEFWSASESLNDPLTLVETALPGESTSISPKCVVETGSLTL